MSEIALEYYKSLPQIVERLNALKYLHEQSAELMNRLTSIETTQATIQTSLQETSGLIEGVKNGLNTNMKTVETNLKSLDERLAKLSGGK